MHKINMSNNTQKPTTSLGNLFQLRGDVILTLIFLLITGLYAVLMFRDQVPIIWLAVLGGSWLIFMVVNRMPGYASPMDLPILGLLALLPLTLAVSIDRTLSLPNLHGLILGIALFYVIVNMIRRSQRLPLVVIALVVLALGLSLLGLVGTEWKESRWLILNPIYEWLPNFVSAISGAPAGAGINANTLGGALVFFVPLLLSLLWDKGSFKRMFLKGERQADTLNLVYKLLLLFALFLASITLILTQSRGAYLGAFVGALVILIWKDKRFLWVIPVLLLLGILAWQLFTDGSFLELMSIIDSSEESTLDSRLILWRNTVYMIQDFPLTGVGLNTFKPVLNNFYKLNIFENKDPSFFHAHNTFLAIAVETGLPTLVLYVTLLGSFFAMAARVYKRGRTFIRALTIGLAGGLIAHQVFGIMDAYTLGKKLGVVLWIFYGVMAALFIHRHKLIRSAKRGLNTSNAQQEAKPDWEQVKRQGIDLLIGLGYWVLISLAAVSLVNFNPYLSLTFAIIGGITLGIFLTTRFRKRNKQSAIERSEQIANSL